MIARPGGGVRERAHAAGPDEPAAEAVARELQEQVQEVTAQLAEPRGARLIAHVASERSEVPDVVCDPLELESNAAERLGSERRFDSREGLDRRRVGERVAHGRIAGDRLGHRDAARRAGPSTINRRTPRRW